MKNSILAKRIKQARKLAGYSQAELSRLLDLSSQVIVARWETGGRTPDADTIRKIASKTKVSIEFLRGETENPNPQGKAFYGLDSSGQYIRFDEFLTEANYVGFPTKESETKYYKPILGEVPSKEPFPEISQAETLIEIPGYMAKDADFALRVNDDSMIAFGIKTRDIILMKKQNTFNPEDIVVLVSESKMNLIKKAFQHGDKIILKDGNDHAYGGEDFLILGKVIYRLGRI